ncbi:MAG: butyrate kinase, partial [Marinilabiliales bacterium]
VVDVNQAYDGNGPFSMERTGSVPPGQLIKLCFSEKLTQEEIEEMITQKGGLFSYLGTSNYAEVEEMIENGDKKAAFYYEAFAYQISKEIGSMYAVLEGNVDGVVFSGDIFYSGTFTEMVKKRVENIAPISVYPHEFQMDALANNAMMIIREECEILEYK